MRGRGLGGAPLQVLAADGVELRRALQEEHQKRKVRAPPSLSLCHSLLLQMGGRAMM